MIICEGYSENYEQQFNSTGLEISSINVDQQEGSKIFTDAAFDIENAHVAGVARNDQGALLSWYQRSKAVSPLQAEARAFQLANHNYTEVDQASPLL